MSTSYSQHNKYCEHNVFKDILARDEEEALFNQFISAHDFAPSTVEAYTFDLRKFAKWFTEVNGERFDSKRITTADISDFRRYLHQDCHRSISTGNRTLVSIRRYLGWLVDRGRLRSNPAALVKELRRQPLAPKGLDRPVVRKLMREVELREDLRAGAIFSLMLHSGPRVGDLAMLEIDDLTISERTGSVMFRHGKGSKQRTVPLPLNARRAIQAYLEIRPPSSSRNVFIGERGPLTVRGIQALFSKYSAFIGVEIHPHLLRHTFAHEFLKSGNISQLAQILGHANLNTTAIYTRDTVERLAEAAERVTY